MGAKSKSLHFDVGLLVEKDKYLCNAEIRGDDFASLRTDPMDISIDDVRDIINETMKCLLVSKRNEFQDYFDLSLDTSQRDVL